MSENSVQTKDSKLELAIAIALFITAQLFTFHRLFFGVNFFDEPFYIALPFRFLFDQKLFVDDLALAQTFSLLIYPFVKLHYLFFKSTESIVLSMRLWFWILYLFLSVFGILIFKKTKSVVYLLPIFATCSLFLPGNIPSLSYNTLGTFWFASGVFLLFRAIQKNQNVDFFLSGMSLALCVLAYPTFVTVLVFITGVLIYREKLSRRNIIFISGAFLVVLLPAILFLERFNYLDASFALAKEYGYSSDKLLNLIHLTHQLLPKKVIVLLGCYIAIIWYLNSRKPQKIHLIVATIPLLAWGLAKVSTKGWSVVPIYFTLLGIFPIWKTKNRLIFRNILWSVYIPSILAGIVATTTSALGLANAQVGLLPAVLVTLMMISDYIDTFDSSTNAIRFIALGSFVILALFTAQPLWDEDASIELTKQVDFGPYKGIYTTPAKFNYLKQISAAIKESIDSNGPLMIYPNFTAGYLIAGIEPAPGILWYQNPKGGVDGLVAHAYESRMSKGSRILKMKMWYATPKIFAENYFDPQSPVVQLIGISHFIKADNQWFSLYAPKIQNY